VTKIVEFLEKWIVTHGEGLPGSTFLAAHETTSQSPRKGKKRAIVAVVHTILVSLYHRLKNKQPYRELGADCLDRRTHSSIFFAPSGVAKLDHKRLAQRNTRCYIKGCDITQFSSEELLCHNLR
jgi:hypothetical protein